MIGKNVTLRKEFIAGDCVYIGQHSNFEGNVKLGNFCLISSYVYVTGSDHTYNKVQVPIVLSGRPEKQPWTVIEDDVWVGTGVTIMRGVRIGEGSIIGAKSVVTKDVEPYSIYVGVPAKKISNRFIGEKKVLHEKFLMNYRMGKYRLLHHRKPKFRYESQ